MSNESKSIVTTEDLGSLSVKLWDLYGRFKKGVYADPKEVFDALQLVIEGKHPTVPTLQVVPDQSLGYPDWVKKRLTPQLEEVEPLVADASAFWFHPKQTSGNVRPTGHEVYAHLLPDQVTYQPKAGDLIHKCVSLRTLRYYEKNPTQIPQAWKGEWIYAWGSVVLDARGDLYVPCLSCRVDQPYVLWNVLDDRWSDYEPGLVRAD